MRRISASVLFAMSIMGGVAHAETFETVNAKVSYDPALLESAAGADAVLGMINRQARSECATVSMISAGLVVDKVCASDIVRQSVEKISHPNLDAEYEASPLYVETVSDRIELAAR